MLGLLFLPWVLVVGPFFVQHLLSYDGLCGPHAPDIPAWPCNPIMYIFDFLGGSFALIGLIMISIPTLLLGLALVLVSSAISFVMRRRRPPPPSP